MGALCGIVSRFEPALAERECPRMLAAQRTYAADGARHVSIGNTCLGFARALCLPEDKFDRQPIAIGDGRFVLVADCRIDNRQELGEACGLKGDIRELCDAAIVAAAFDRWGVDCFDRLRGDFAIAIWDDTKKQFILARDPVGAAPLYFHRSAGLLAVASMPQGLNILSALPGMPDVEFIAHTLRTFGCNGPGSHWRGINRVMAGHFAVLDFDGVKQHDYWSRPAAPLIFRKPDDYAEALREKIECAVSRRLRGETRIATHLSAGLDSSTITGAAAALLRDTGHVFAFTSAPRDGYSDYQGKLVIDETSLAAKTAAMHSNVDHTVSRPTAAWSTQAVERQFALAQQPSANICNLSWIHRIADAARDRGLKVMMPAQLGNFAMSYGGEQLLTDPLSRGEWGQALSAFMSLKSGRLGHLRKLLGLYGRSWLFGGYLSKDGAGTPARDTKATRYRPEMPKWDYFSGLRHAISRVDMGPNRKALYAGWGIDERDPTFDRDLFDFVAAVPHRIFHAGGRDRALIRAAARGWVAPEVLNERRRGYQAVDWHEGLTAHREWICEELEAIGEHAPANDIIDIERLQRLMANLPSGNWHDWKVTSDYRHAVLRGISTGHFMRRAARTNR